MRVLYVSKPIEPPWHDGSKNLVRDLAEHVVDIEPWVMVSDAATQLASRVRTLPIYGAAQGGYAPKLQENARVLRQLLGKPAHDLWHFVFAPNPASSSAAHVAISVQNARTRLNGSKRPRVVQTVASAPRSYERVRSLLFGDRVVVQSQHTLDRVLGAGADATKLRKIVPCARAPEAPSQARIATAVPPEAQAGYLIYPGDLEISSGARTVIEAVTRGLTQLGGGLSLLMACRAKTARAAEIQRELEARVPSDLRSRVHWIGTAQDLPALLAGARAVVFPVDDLYGKVDVPLVLLESLALGTPLVLARGGPLEEIDSALFVPPADPDALIARVDQLLGDAALARDLVTRGAREFAEKFSPETVAAQYRALYAEL